MTEAEAPRPLPSPVEALSLWWRLLGVLAPVLLAAYALNLVLLAWWAAAPPEPTGLSAPRWAGALLIVLSASWLGQVWAGAAVGLARDGRRPTARAVGQAVRQAGLGPWRDGLARLVICYLPLVGADLLIQLTPRPENALSGLHVAASLVLLPLWVVLCAFHALVAPVSVNERPADGMTTLRRARELADRRLLSLGLWGGLISLALLLTSWLPQAAAPQAGLLPFPNHVLGSMLWIFLAVSYTRAVQADEATA